MQVGEEDLVEVMTVLEELVVVVVLDIMQHQWLHLFLHLFLLELQELQDLEDPEVDLPHLVEEIQHLPVLVQ
jgi:hypothetical protein